MVRVRVGDDDDVCFGQVVEQASALGINRVRVETDIPDGSKPHGCRSEGGVMAEALDVLRVGDQQGCMLDRCEDWRC